MTTLSATIPPTIIQEAAEQRLDLAADLKALQPANGGNPDAAVALQRPAILRRLADALAVFIPAGTDRLVAQAGTDATLAAAVSLHSGIAFALVDVASGEVIGELHRSERTVLLSYEAKDSEKDVLTVLAKAGAKPGIGLHVVGPEAQNARPSSLTRHTLFRFAELSTDIKESHHD